MLWLDHGYLEGDDTDAHIDTLARFAAERRDRVPCPRRSVGFALRELHADGRGNRRVAHARGKPYRLFPLPRAQPIVDDGRRLAASYANYLIVNGAVLMPPTTTQPTPGRRRA